jgi:WhiB family transcriptional regulator, redox-sensing transcriptional regulator
MAVDRVGARSSGGAALLAAARRTWQDEARCRGEDAVLFFGPNHHEPKPERLAREAAAKRLCAQCPVQVPCRRFALEHGEDYGVWGGLGESDRRGLGMVAAH